MFWGDPGIISNFLRAFFSILDSIGYFFLGGIFNVFFDIANAQFFQSGVINTFYARIQMILGIFMVFRISIALLQIIINPDTFKDKNKGASSIVMRIAVMLILLTLIIPIEGISEDDPNTLNQQIRANGILFGFLNQIQNSVVQDNVLGKLILGYNVEDSTGTLELGGTESVGDVLTAEIAHAFITPTLNENSEYTEVTIDNYQQAAACPTEIEPSLNPMVTSKALLNHINDTCEFNEEEIYAFSYIGFGGVICAVVMTIIVIGFTLDVAVRAIKLALLRLIAPIPIISYISPGQEKNGAFGNWVKTLSSTYLSLFIRLIIIYFGIYLIILLRNGELVTWVDTSLLANIFVIIGILVFMKEAPKFFQDMLGIKGDGKLFSGIGTMLGAAALTGGLAGSVATGARAAWEENKMAGRPAWMGIGGAITSGLTSGIGGAFVGAKALATADKKAPSSVMSAMQKRNAMRASHSTALGRMSSNAYGMFTGRTLAEKDKAILDASQEASKAISSWASDAQDEALKQTVDSGYYGVAEINGTKYGFNWDQLEAAIAGADSNGNFYIGNQKFNRSDFTTETQNAIKKSQTAQYLSSVYDKTTGNFKNPRLQTSWKMLRPKLDNANIDYSDLYAAEYDNDTGQIIPNADPLPFLDPSKKGAALGKVQSQIEEYTNSLKHTKHIANHNNSKN